MGGKNSEAFVHTDRDISSWGKTGLFSSTFFYVFSLSRLFTFLGLSSLNKFPVARIKGGTLSHPKSFSNFAVIFNGFE